MRTWSWALPLLVGAGVAGAEGDALREEWVAQDLALARRLAALVPPGDDVGVDALLERMDPSDVEADRDLGHGARCLRLAFYGGHASVWMSLLAHEGRVVELRLDHRFGPELDDALAARVRAAWGTIAVHREDGSLRWAWTHAALRQALDDARARALGGAERPELPPGLRAAARRLADPLVEHHYGHVFGEGGDPPEGRVALERLVAAGARPALRDVARGANPEGRVYAAEGLRRLARGGTPLDEAERRLVEAARMQKTPIRCADGCAVLWREAAEALADG